MFHGLPWWCSGKESPYNAGDAGSIPGQGTRIPHAAGQLSPCATTTELNAPQLESLCAANYRARVFWSLCATTREKPARHNERSRMPQQRSCVPQLRPDGAKNKLNK